MTGRGPIALGKAAIALRFANSRCCSSHESRGLGNRIRRTNLLPCLRIERTITNTFQDGEGLAVQIAKAVF